MKETLCEERICVVIPTYNNGGTIGDVVRRALGQCRDVIVVNDGCTDETAQVLNGIDGITVVTLDRNRGKGIALREGFRKALAMGFTYAVTLDGDGQHFPEDIPLLLQAHREHSGALIVGSRQMEGAEQAAGSRFANKFSNFWFGLQTGCWLPDTQTGYRLYPLKRLHGLGLLTSRYEAELELMVFASWHGVELVPTPVHVYYPPKEERVSHFRPGWDFARISLLNTVLCVLAVVYGLPLRLWRWVTGLMFLALVVTPAFAQVNIWEGTDCGKTVTLTPYTVTGEGHTAVIVCPGGSYFWHDMETEGHDVARWLQQQGIAAFVLRYRTAYVPDFILRYRLVVRGNRYPDPQDDLRQALRYVRSHARDYGIDANRVGAMGFSAGGHLVMSAAELFDKAEWPAFIVPVYPVVTMTEQCVHKRSRRGLLGESRTRNKTLRDKLSLERHVPDGCPPVFLVNCKDDPVVDYRNSVLLDSALTAHQVPHVYLQYETGGHGFGASDVKGTAECRAWREEFIRWIERLRN